MKEQEKALEKLMSWAREAQDSKTFDLSSTVRARVLAVWRQDRRKEWNDGILRFLKWAVAYSVVIMTLSILVSTNLKREDEGASHDSSPHVVFHSRMSHEIYGP